MGRMECGEEGALMYGRGGSREERTMAGLIKPIEDRCATAGGGGGEGGD